MRPISSVNLSGSETQVTLYGMAKFLHVLGAIGMFAALALECACLAQLRRARTGAQVREWAQIGRWLRWLGTASLFAVLLPGFYMVATVWRGGAPWITFGFVALLLIGALGAAASRPLGAAIRLAIADAGPLALEHQARLQAPLPWISVQARAAMLVGVVYLMTSRPDLREGLVTLATTLGAALIVATLGLRAVTASGATR